MSNKWNKDEELQVIKAISNGKSINEISEIHSRSPSAIELRLKKIIYENYAIEKRSFKDLSKLLKLDTDKIAQYYYSYKDFREKHTQGNKHLDHDITIEHDERNELNALNAHTGQLGGSRTNEFKLNEQIDDAFKEPNPLSKIEHKLKRLEIENRILKLVVENKDLTQQLNSLIKEGKVSPSIKKLIKMLRSNKVTYQL
jgi:DNA-binding transcriptional ArsR family regulator